MERRRNHFDQSILPSPKHAMVGFLYVTPKPTLLYSPLLIKSAEVQRSVDLWGPFANGFRIPGQLSDLPYTHVQHLSYSAPFSLLLRT